MSPHRQWGRAMDPAQARLRAARRRRGMFLLPSLFTSAGIGLGFYAITQIFDAVTAGLTPYADPSVHLDHAAIAICFAIPFDALDGRIARMTNTVSDFGRELDSLADSITFGMAPALLAWIWGLHFLDLGANPNIVPHLLQIGTFICFLYLLCGVSRLARFNISHDPEPENPGRKGAKYFVGMPIPAAAGLVASTVHLFYGIPNSYWWLAIVWLVLVATLGFLMVSKWRFWSGKEINLGNRQPIQLLAVIAIVLFLLLWPTVSRATWFLIGLVYMFSGIWARAAYSWQRRRRHFRRDEEIRHRELQFEAEAAGEPGEPDARTNQTGNHEL